MDKINLVFCKFTIDKSIDSKSFYADLIRKEYSEIDGWGFSDVDIVDDVVSATLLKSITAYYRSWNTETSEMERQSYSMVKEIRFFVDFEKNYLSVEGSNADMNKIKQAFRSQFWNMFTYEPLTLKPFNYLQIFEKDKILTKIEEVTINDFACGSLLFGRYVAKILSISACSKELEEYKANLIRIKAILTYHDEQVSLIVSKNNSLCIYCNDNTKYSFLKYLTSKLY